jgi:hypothetical protein
MGVWHGVAMDSLKFYPSSPYSSPYSPVSEVGCPQGGHSAALLHPFGHLTSYAYQFCSKSELIWNHCASLRHLLVSSQNFKTFF